MEKNTVKRKLFYILIILVMSLSLTAPAFAQSPQADDGSSTRQVPAGGTTSIQVSVAGAVGPQQPELRQKVEGQGEAGEFNRVRPGFKNGKFPKKPLDVPVVAPIQNLP